MLGLDLPAGNRVAGYRELWCLLNERVAISRRVLKVGPDPSLERTSQVVSFGSKGMR